MFDKVYIVEKLNGKKDPNVAKAVHEIRRGVKLANGPARTKQYTIAKTISKRTEIDQQTLIIAVGGDGTMLQAMKLAAKYDATAYGINLGNLGFLTEETYKAGLIDLLASAIPYLLEAHPNSFKVEHRSIISLMGTNRIAVNEFSIFREEPDSMVYYNIIVDGMNAGFHRANSLLISTPTGSTAYSLSAGGALLIPNLNVMQIVPVAPFTLTSRPILVSGNSTIELKAWGGNVQVKSDGATIDGKRNATKQKPYNASFTSDKSAKVLTRHNQQFFSKLTQKLGWIDHWERIK